MTRLAFLFLAVTGAAALDNGLGKKPGLGWNSVRCSAQCSAQLRSSSALCCCVLRSDLRRCAQDYCTNCSGPLAAPGLYGALSGVRTQGYGDEVFVKHIADHMHTVKVSSSAIGCFAL